MEKLKFIMVFHNHQPVGNFDYVLEKAYNQAYKPFLDVFKRFNLKMTLHISGPLFFWLKEHKPGYIEDISELVNKGDIEIIGSGYSEPILAAIPRKDAIEQLILYSRVLKETFGHEISGSWLTERVWEPHLPEIFHDGGIKYIITDDYHFLRSGFNLTDLDGYYISEFENKKVAIYPGSEKLRYYIPFKTVPENKAFFEDAYNRGIKTLIFADDGEKFGIWPETYKWVYDEKWLFKFFEFLSESPFIETITLKEHFENNPAKGICYLPTTSYPELGEWALPPDAASLFKKYYDRFKNYPDYEDIKPFFQGGQWKNFLSKYRESQIIHKKMVFISEALRDRPIEEKKELFLGQCNDAYWHGIFGGLYLPHLRREINSNLIKALKRAFNENVISQYDFDVDNRVEIFLKNDIFSSIIDLDDGGTIAFLDFLPKNLNLTDTLTRRKESYHLRLTEAQNAEAGTKTIHDIFKVKEEGLHNLLTYDKYYRASHRIHLFKDINLDDFSFMRFSPAQSAVKSYHVLNAISDDNQIISLSDMSGEIKKNFTFSKNDIFTELEVKNVNGFNIIGLEFNFNLFAPQELDRYFLTPDGEKLFLSFRGELKDISELVIVDEWFGINISLKSSLLKNIYIYPIYTVSLSEDGVEKTYQGSCLLFYSFIKDQNFKTNFDISVKELK